jgi:hypothetical protein
MPAPNLETLFNLEPAVEKALRARLTARFPSLAPYIQRETQDLPAQYVAMQFTTGADTGRIHALADGTFRPDSFACTLQLQIQTVRIKGRPDSHGFFRGKLRALVMEARHDTAFLPYYVLNPFDLQSGTESIQTGDDTDLSAIVFAGIIGIRPSAWPA